MGPVTVITWGTLRFSFAYVGWVGAVAGARIVSSRDPDLVEERRQLLPDRVGDVRGRGVPAAADLFGRGRSDERAVEASLLEAELQGEGED